MGKGRCEAWPLNSDPFQNEMLQSTYQIHRLTSRGKRGPGTECFAFRSESTSTVALRLENYILVRYKIPQTSKYRPTRFWSIISESSANGINWLLETFALCSRSYNEVENLQNCEQEAKSYRDEHEAKLGRLARLKPADCLLAGVPYPVFTPHLNESQALYSEFFKRNLKSSMKIPENAKVENLNMKLIKALPGGAGADGNADSWDPVPPDQILWDLHYGSPPDKLVAAVKWHTIHHGHPTKGYGKRSPFAVNETGKPMRLRDIARYLHWTDPAFARRHLAIAVTQGRLVEDDQKRLWLCGKIPLPDEIQGESEDYEEPEEKQLNFPAYFSRQLEKLPPHDRRAFEKHWLRSDEFHSRLEADALAAARERRQMHRERLCARYGLHLKITPKNGNIPKRCVELDVKEIPDDIQEVFEFELTSEAEA